MALGKEDGWRHETVLIQDISCDGRVEARRLEANNASQSSIDPLVPRLSMGWAETREMPSVIRITPPLILMKIALVPLHPSQNRHLHNSFGLCGIAGAIFVAYTSGGYEISSLMRPCLRQTSSRITIHYESRADALRWMTWS